MQDLGPDMKDLVHRASEEYPLKESEDKWHVIERVISDKRMQRKTGFLQYFFAGGFLLLLLLIGLLTGDPDIPDIYNEPATSAPKSNARHQPGNASRNNPGNDLNDNKLNAPIRAHETFSGRQPGTNKNIQIREEKTTQEPNEQIGNINRGGSKIDYILNEKTYPGRNPITTAIEVTPRSIASVKNNFEPVAQQRNKGLYYGIVAGLDVNAVKDQPFSNSNIEAGVVVGYRLNPAFSIESGVSFVKKYYNTAGNYFSMDDMSPGMPGGMEMMEVNGSSKVIRIPIQLRTDLFNKKNYTLFSSVGLSSYIMTEENNMYHVMMNGTEEKMFKSYKKDRNYFATTIDFTIGYEKKIGKKNQLRIQPYLQLPVKGIGVGKLPLKSAGIRIAFTHNQ